MIPIEDVVPKIETLRNDPQRARSEQPELFAAGSGEPPAVGSTLAGREVVEDWAGDGRTLRLGPDPSADPDEDPGLVARRLDGTDPSARARLLADLAALSRAESDAIARPLGFAVHEGFVYVLRPFVPGKPLSEILRALEPEEVPPDAPTWRLAAGARGGGANVTGAKIVCRIGLFASHALAAAHRAGVVHGALTPENLICDDTVRPTVVDFALGTSRPPYRAPEVERGAPPTPASDLWSLGVVLHRCLTRGPLFGPSVGDDPEALARAVGRRRPVRPLKVNFKASREMETLTLWLLERDPSRRPERADELHEELDRYHRNEPIRRKPPSLLRRLFG